MALRVGAKGGTAHIGRRIPEAHTGGGQAARGTFRAAENESYTRLHAGRQGAGEGEVDDKVLSLLLLTVGCCALLHNVTLLYPFVNNLLWILSSLLSVVYDASVRWGAGWV